MTARATSIGLRVELVHEALERPGDNAETTMVTWKEAMTGLGDGRFDGSAAMWRSPDREAFLLFSKPYLESAHGRSSSSQ